MSVHKIREKRDCELLLTANHQLEQLYFQQQTPCLALHISQNYSQLLNHDVNIKLQQEWKENAKKWWELYWCLRDGRKLRAVYMNQNISWLQI